MTPAVLRCQAPASLRGLLDDTPAGADAQVALTTAASKPSSVECVALRRIQVWHCTPTASCRRAVGLFV